MDLGLLSPCLILPSVDTYVKVTWPAALSFKPLKTCLDAKKKLRFRLLRLRTCFIGMKYNAFNMGWSGGAMVLGKLQVPGRPTIWLTVGQGPTVLAVVGAGGGGLDIFTLLYPFSPLSPSLWETARYRLKYCLKGPLNPKQPTNQHI